MKLYQVISLEKKLLSEITILKNRFKNNNSIVISDSKDYDSIIILDEIKDKVSELIKIKFEIERSLLNIGELKIQNDEYNKLIELLNNTPTPTNMDYVCSFTRPELDVIIKEYQDIIDKNNETIDYYYFVTDIEF